MKRLFVASSVIAMSGFAAALLAAPGKDQLDRPGATAPPPERVEEPANDAPVPPEIPVALLVDMATGQTLYSRDERRRFVPASVTKVMTTYTAFKLVAAGRLPLDKVVTITPELERDWWAEGSTMFLKAGDKVTVRQLLMGITTVSANDASVALGVEAAGSLDRWLDTMNANAAELGLRDTHFGTPNGWPDEGRTFTSARDLAMLGEALILRYPALYREFFGHRGMTYRDIAQANHDPITGVVDGADGIKTGYTRQAGYNFIGSAERDGRRLMMVIAGAPTPPLRNTTARNLLQWGFDAFDTRHLLPARSVVGVARVQDGAAGAVNLQTERPVMTSLKQGSTATTTLAVRYRGPIEAPIAKGQRIAWLRVRNGDGQPYDVPLVAADEVPQANVFQRIFNGLKGPFT